MTRWRSFAAGLLAVAMSGCAGLTTEEILEVLPATDLAASDDPAVRGAGASSRTISDIEQAQDSMNTAVQDHDHEAIERAIVLRPFDPYYPLVKAALLTAAGDDPGALRAADHAAEVFNADAASGLRRNLQMADAYLVVRESYPRGTPEWERTNRVYCAALERYTEQLGSGPDSRATSLFVTLSHPTEDCPTP